MSILPTTRKSLREKSERAARKSGTLDNEKRVGVTPSRFGMDGRWLSNDLDCLEDIDVGINGTHAHTNHAESKASEEKTDSVDPRTLQRSLLLTATAPRPS